MLNSNLFCTIKLRSSQFLSSRKEDDISYYSTINDLRQSLPTEYPDPYLKGNTSSVTYANGGREPIDVMYKMLNEENYIWLMNEMINFRNYFWQKGFFFILYLALLSVYNILKKTPEMMYLHVGYLRF